MLGTSPPPGGGGGDTSVRNGRLLFRGAKGRNVVLPILSLELWVNKHTMQKEDGKVGISDRLLRGK